MAHTYASVKSWVDPRPGVYSGYVKITFSDDYVANGYAIPAASVNPNMSTIFELSVVGTPAFEGAAPVFLEWDYDNQKLTAIDIATGVELADLDALDGVTVMFAYVGT